MKYVYAAFAAAAVIGTVTPTGRGVAQQDQDRWTWRGRVAAGRVLEIRGVNGSVTAERASGNEVEVVAMKHGRRDDPAEVSIEVVEGDDGVTICAVYPGRRNRCQPGGGNMSVNNNDVQVDFTVRVPAGIRFEGYTVNGDVEAMGLNGPATVETVNGSARVETESGDARARTVNGSITATLRSLTGSGTLSFQTVNGGITLTVPNGLNAELEAETVNGAITTDFPVTVMGRMTARRMNGRIGTGGRLLRMETVNGSIRLRRLG